MFRPSLVGKLRRYSLMKAPVEAGTKKKPLGFFTVNAGQYKAQKPTQKQNSLNDSAKNQVISRKCRKSSQKMTSVKGFLVMVLVVAAVFQTADCYFRLGRELRNDEVQAEKGHQATNQVFDLFLKKFMTRVAYCVKKTDAIMMKLQLIFGLTVLTAFVLQTVLAKPSHKHNVDKDMNIDNLLSGLDAKDKDLFKKEFAKEAKRYGGGSNSKLSKKSSRGKPSKGPKRVFGKKTEKDNEKRYQIPQPLSFADVRSKIKKSSRKKKSKAAKHPGFCDPQCAHTCMPQCDFRCCVPGFQGRTNTPTQQIFPPVTPYSQCGQSCPQSCAPSCSQQCCASAQAASIMPCGPTCSPQCAPQQCNSACCSAMPMSPPPQMQALAPPQQMPCGPQCAPQCAPQQCSQSCCSSMPVPTMPMMPPPLPQQQQMPRIPSPCGLACSAQCAPQCSPSCCTSMPPQYHSQHHQ
eukprot:gene8620-9550_t